MGKEKKSFSVVKYIFFGFNIFVWLLGCGVLTVGIWLWASRGASVSVIPMYSFLSAPTLCLLTGIIVLATGFLGCAGAFLENQCMHIGYFVLVMLVFVLEVTAGTLGFYWKGQIRNVLHHEMSGGIRYDYRTDHQMLQAGHNRTLVDQDMLGWSVMLDTVQADLQCCGVDNHTDWYNIAAWPGEMRVPDSCCVTPHDGCGMTQGSWHSRGCLKEVEYWFTRNMYVLGVTGVTVGSVQILAMAAAIAQFCYIRSKRFPL